METAAESSAVPSGDGPSESSSPQVGGNPKSGVSTEVSTTSAQASGPASKNHEPDQAASAEVIEDRTSTVSLIFRTSTFARGPGSFARDGLQSLTIRLGDTLQVLAKPVSEAIQLSKKSDVPSLPLAPPSKYTSDTGEASMGMSQVNPAMDQQLLDSKQTALSSSVIDDQRP